MLVNSWFWQEFDYTFFLKSLLLCMKKPPQSNRNILTLTETESRLSFGMTSNKTYHFQITVNHHRFIKVWTSIADAPTSKIFVKIFVWKKYGSEIPYLPTVWTYVQAFVVFFLWRLSLVLIDSGEGGKAQSSSSVGKLQLLWKLTSGYLMNLRPVFNFQYVQIFRIDFRGC